MYQPLPRSGANDPATATSVGERPAVLGKVLGLLGFAFLFTAGGAIIGANLGPGAFVVSAIGSFATLIGLMFARERSPLNLVLLYSFAVFEGLLLGLVLEEYVASGSAAVVLDAAATTAVVPLAAGAYGFSTQRDLRGLGGVLTVGLIAVIVASLIGIFVQLPALYIGISAVAALLFTGFLVYDLNRVANSRGKDTLVAQLTLRNEETGVEALQHSDVIRVDLAAQDIFRQAGPSADIIAMASRPRERLTGLKLGT